jgi:hypothetical protein
MNVIKTISIPIEIAEQINQILENDQTTFSGFVKNSIKRRIREIEKKGKYIKGTKYH